MRSISDEKQFDVNSPKEFENLNKQVVKDLIENDVKAFKEVLKKKIIENYKSSVKGTRHLFGNNASKNSDAIIRAIENLDLVKTHSDDKKIVYKIHIASNETEELKNGLIQALEYGTGVYGPKGTTIRPKNGKKYMFIPSSRLIDHVHNKNFSREKRFKK